MARLENTSQNAVLLGLLAIGSLLGLIVSVTTVRESLFSINKRQRGRAEAGYGSHNDESSKEKDNRTSTDPPGKSEARCSERQSEHTALRDHGDRVQDSGAIDAHGCSTSWGNRQSSDVSSTSSSGSRRRSPETSRQVMQQRLCVKSPKIVSEPRNVAELFKKGHSSRVEGESQGTQEHSQRLGLEHGEMLGIKAAASPERNQMPEESPSTPTKVRMTCALSPMRGSHLEVETLSLLVSR